MSKRKEVTGVKNIVQVEDLQVMLEEYNEWMTINEIVEVMGIDKRRCGELLNNGERKGVIEVQRVSETPIRYQWVGFSTKSVRECAAFWNEHFDVQVPDFPNSMIIGKTEHFLDDDIGEDLSIPPLTNQTMRLLLRDIPRAVTL